MSLHHTAEPECPLCLEKLKDAHPEIAKWFKFIKEKFKNVHVSWTFRDQENQDMFFEQRKTKVKWPNSPHNKHPSRAMDLFRILEHGADFRLCFQRELMEAFKEAGAPLVYGLEWPGGWDSDHFQLNKDLS